MRQFSLLFIFLLTIRVPSVHSLHCTHHDQSSLLRLKHSLVFDSDGSLSLDTWNSSSDCCVWDGVICSPGGDVIGLDLSWQYISGGIDDSNSSLFDLCHLQSLDLSNNNFSGTHIPSGIGKLVNLLHLNLSESSFGGQVPIEISSLTSLLTLNLGKGYDPDPPLMELENPKFSTLVQNLTSLIDLNLDGVNMSSEGEGRQWGRVLSSLPNLRTLTLSYCSLFGPLHDSLGKLQALTYIDLTGNKLLTGTLPEFIGNITALEFLFFSGCGFSGSITHINWENLENLTSLALSENMLNGSIPLSLFSLPSMRGLYLASNRFRGQLGEVDSANLMVLDLSSNKFDGPVPSFIFNLDSLVELKLSHNNFSGNIDLGNMIQNLGNLSRLDLSFNSLSIIKSVGFSSSSMMSSSLPQLVMVNLASCNLKEFPSFLRNLSTLFSLDLSENGIYGQIPNWIWGYAHIIDLSHNYLIGFETLLSNFTSPLGFLKLKSNLLQGQIPPAFGNFFPLIRLVSLSNNNFHGSIPLSLCNINIDHEVVVDLSDNSLSGTIPPCLLVMNLGVLNLKRNNLSGNIPDAFRGNCSLETLDLSENQFQGMIPKSVVNCKALRVLNLGKNDLSGGFPCWLILVTNLTVLVLRSNRFYGPVRCAPSNEATNSWSKLQIIDIAVNSFDAELSYESFKNWTTMMTGRDVTKPKLDYLEFGGYYQDTVVIINKGVFIELEKILIVYTAIDFSCNRFEGSIPHSIGDLTSLYALNLSHNHFTGSIPPSIGNLKEMESLDLADNRLSGVIPEHLASLTFIAFLNLSFNHLVGKIPTSTQLQSFSESSYRDNKGLYGPPLKINCVNTCGPHGPPVDPRSVNDGKEIDWQLIRIEIGYVVGLGSVIGSFMFRKRWRVRCFEHTDRLIFKIFPSLEPHQRNGGRRVRKRSQMQS